MPQCSKFFKRGKPSSKHKRLCLSTKWTYRYPQWEGKFFCFFGCDTYRQLSEL